MFDMVNVEDNQPEIIFGPALNGESPDNDVPPFYISLILHDFVLHNAMFVSGVSHNLMPKAIMDKLGLDVVELILFTKINTHIFHQSGLVVL